MPSAGRQHPQSRLQPNAFVRRQPETRQDAPNGEAFDHRFIASSETLASDHGVILLSAWDFTKYRQRPRWISMHDISGFDNKLTEISLGRTVDIRIEDGLPPEKVGETGKGAVAYVRYAQTAFAQEVRMLYDDGGLDDVSVRWDFRTEEFRNPFEEEVQKWGEDLLWVTTFAELLELSAVILGADQGAQIIRGEVIEAVSRCRSAGHDLDVLRSCLRASKARGYDRDPISARTVIPVPTPTDRALDVAAVTSALEQLQGGLDQLEIVVQAAEGVRDVIADAVSSVQALLVAEPVASTDDDDRSAMGEKTVKADLTDVRRELTSLQSKIGELLERTEPDQPLEMKDVPAAVKGLLERLSALEASVKSLAREEAPPAEGAAAPAEGAETGEAEGAASDESVSGDDDATDDADDADDATAAGDASAQGSGEEPASDGDAEGSSDSSTPENDLDIDFDAVLADAGAAS